MIPMTDQMRKDQKEIEDTCKIYSWKDKKYIRGAKGSKFLDPKKTYHEHVVLCDALIAKGEAVPA